MSEELTVLSEKGLIPHHQASTSLTAPHHQASTSLTAPKSSPYIGQTHTHTRAYTRTHMHTHVHTHAGGGVTQ